MNVDVILLTKNSAARLKECLESIYRNVPINHLIVVDGCSTDRTVEIVLEFQKQYGNVLVMQDRGNRASARQIGIQQVSTEWFMFVDSDVILCANWFEKAEKYLGKDVGGIWGIEVWSTIRSPAMLRMFLWVTRKIFDLRGGTHDTLVRTDLVRDIKIPRNLHVFEDAYIRDWIVRKGYKIIACYNPFCIHYRPEDVWSIRGSLRLVAEAIACGSFRLLGRLFFAYGIYAGYCVYYSFAKKVKQS